MADPANETSTMTDTERLDWLDEPGCTKSRMDDVIAMMYQSDLREAIDRARAEEMARLIRVRRLLGNGGME